MFLFAANNDALVASYLGDSAIEILQFANAFQIANLNLWLILLNFWIINFPIGGDDKIKIYRKFGLERWGFVCFMMP